MPNKLLFVVNHPEFFLSHRLPIALAAKNNGWDVVLASSRTQAVKGVIAHGIRWHEIPLQPGGVSPIADVACLMELVRLYRRERPNVVHHVTIKAILYGGLAARLAGVPAVVSAFSGLGYLFIDTSRKGRIMRVSVARLLTLSLRQATGSVILQNDDDRRVLLERGVVKEEQITMIRGSGVDTGVFMPAAEPDGPITVTLPTRMLWDKGVGEFVDAAAILKKRGLTARFRLVGAPDDNNPSSISADRLKAWDASGVVEWCGHVDDMPSVYHGSHIVCLPSYREGLPKTLIEGSACGRPLIATDVPGCREIVLHGVTGLLVPPQNSIALADAIERLALNRETRREYGTRGRQLVEECFSLELVVTQTLELYERLLRGARSR